MGWEKVCFKKEKNGLGVPNIRLQNLTLLRKWWARFETEKGSFWKTMVIEKYYVRDNAAVVGDFQRRMISNVWSGIVSVGVEGMESGNVVGKGLMWEVGGGSNIWFWKYVWVGEQPLGEAFPRKRNLSEGNRVRIGEMGRWSNGVWSWELKWRRNIFGRDCEEEREHY